ncbi:MAG: hemolysin III family protein [bacterium]|nr:hemolysin III family protein [bacterium]
MIRDANKRKMTLIEEIFNAITHGLGVILSVAGLVIAVVLAARIKNGYAIVSSAIYGSTLILLYVSSTLYHSFREGKVKNLFKVFDHSSIYILIAGTYTPFTLLPLRGGWGWTIFGIIWGLAILGILFKVFFVHRFNFVSTVIYLLMGWFIIIAAKPLFSAIPFAASVFLVAGGLCYTLGAVFYIFDRKFFFHIIWHLFVLAGSILHFFSVILIFK